MIKFACIGVRWCECVSRMVEGRIPKKFLNVKLTENTQGEEDFAQDVNNKESVGTD